jgi:hypothetical protein
LPLFLKGNKGTCSLFLAKQRKAIFSNRFRRLVLLVAIIAAAIVPVLEQKHVAKFELGNKIGRLGLEWRPMQRRRITQSQSLEERLATEAKRLREEAKLLPPGAGRDEILRRARQAETGSNMSEWLRSPGLRRPE